MSYGAAFGSSNVYARIVPAILSWDNLCNYNVLRSLGKPWLPNSIEALFYFLKNIFNTLHQPCPCAKPALEPFGYTTFIPVINLTLSASIYHAVITDGAIFGEREGYFPNLFATWLF